MQDSDSVMAVAAEDASGPYQQKLPEKKKKTKTKPKPKTKKIWKNSDQNTTTTTTSTTKDKKLLLGKYELVGLLGHGSFAKVYEAQDATTGQAVAIKCMSKQDLQERGLSSSIEREVTALRRLRHPNVVRIYEVLACRRRAYIVMELARGGELFAQISRDGPLQESKARVLFRQLVSAVGYCHSRGVFHRDLKPENLLLYLPEDNDGDDQAEPCLKITDFGLSAVSAASSGVDAADPKAAQRQQLLRTQCGTPAYVAPEVLAKKGRPYDGAKADVWSCGVILYAMTAGYLPFNDKSLTTMCRKICLGRFSYPSTASRGLRRLLSRLLDTNPSTRITVEEILDDPWFNAGLQPKQRSDLRMLTRYGCREDEYGPGSGKHEIGAEGRELNAFDIISFSSGLDLSGMFEQTRPAATERFVLARTVEEVEATVERTAKEAGLDVRKREGNGVGLVVRQKGGGAVVASVEILRLASGVVVVEVGPGPEGAYEGSPYKVFSKQRLGPALARLLPVQ